MLSTTSECVLASVIVHTAVATLARLYCDDLAVGCKPQLEFDN